MWQYYHQNPDLFFHPKECNHCEPRRWWGQKGDGNRWSAEHWVCAHSQGSIIFLILILLLILILILNLILIMVLTLILIFCRREKRPMRLTGWFSSAMLKYAVSTMEGVSCVAIVVGSGQLITTTGLRSAINSPWNRRWVMPLYNSTAAKVREKLPSCSFSEYIPYKLEAPHVQKQRDATLIEIELDVGTMFTTIALQSWLKAWNHETIYIS